MKVLIFLYLVLSTISIIPNWNLKDSSKDLLPTGTDTCTYTITHRLMYNLIGKLDKTITRSGTTFTATCIDGSTFSFTQQDNNTIPAAYCDTTAGTAAKTASCTGYALAANTYLHIIIVNSNTSANALTLNVNGKGAKPIYINEDPSGSTNYTLPAGSYICYYDGTNYYFNTDGKLPHLSGAAYTGVDTTLVQGSASTNVPTSAAVVDYINSMGYGANNVYV